MNRYFDHYGLSLFTSSNISGLKVSIALFSYGHSSFLLATDDTVQRLSPSHFQSLPTPQLSFYVDCAFGQQHTDGSWCSARLPFLPFNWSVDSITFNKMNWCLGFKSINLLCFLNVPSVSYSLTDFSYFMSNQVFVHLIYLDLNVMI